MNICIVYGEKMASTKGGVEGVCHNLAGELIKLKSVRIFHLFINHNDESEIPDVCYEQLPWGNTKEKRLRSQSFVESYIRKNNIDIIWNHNQGGAFHELVYAAGKATHTKVVSVLHNNPSVAFGELIDRLSWYRFNSQEYGKHKDFLFLLLKYPFAYLNSFRRSFNKLRHIYAHSDYLCLLSEHFRKEFLKLSKLKDNSKIRAITNPIVPCDYHYSRTDKKNRIVVVSRHVWKQKRIDRIIRIWSKIQNNFPEWELIILGDGANHNDYVRVAEKAHAERLSFVGMQSPDQYYRTAKILCLTSSWEGFGLVLTEAQQYGCVPIAYKSYASLDDIITDGETGYSVTPYKEKEYISKLSELMSNEEIREKMAKKAIEHAKKFHIDRIAHQWLRLFEEVINDQKQH